MLDILADRAGSGHLEGEILFDGHARSKSFIPSYVQQEDSLLGSFTTRETLMYTAALTLPMSLPPRVRCLLVTNMMKDLGLEICADTRVGDVFTKGLSGGQKRRLSLGLSLITRPVIMLLDEPTSGLDAASSLGIMKLLFRLAKEKNIAVICTIHQPSSEMWRLFDKLCLLSAGREIYFGDASESINYFRSLGHECPTFSNPADYFLSLINTDFEGHADVSVLSDKFNELIYPEIRKTVHPQSVSVDVDFKSNGPVIDDEHSHIFSNINQNPSYWHFLVLLHRNFLNTYRNPGVILIRLIMYFMLGVMIGAMFLDNGNKSTDKAIQGRIACLFFVFAFMVIDYVL